jgi:hypothetical protein
MKHPAVDEPLHEECAYPDLMSTTFAAAIILTAAIAGWTTYSEGDVTSTVLCAAFAAWIFQGVARQYFIPSGNLAFLKLYRDRIVWGGEGLTPATLPVQNIGQVWYGDAIGEARVFTFFLANGERVQVHSPFDVRQDRRLYNAIAAAVQAPVLYNREPRRSL